LLSMLTHCNVLSFALSKRMLIWSHLEIGLVGFVVESELIWWGHQMSSPTDVTIYLVTPME